MSRRSTQMALVLLLLIGLASLLWGCGGGGDQSSTSSSIAKTTRTTAARSVQSAVEELLYTKVAVTENTPEEYVAAVGESRPVAMIFYVPGSIDDEKVLEAFQSMQPEFPEYEFLIYDYKNPAQYGDLSMLLQVNYPPETVLVDRRGAVRNIWNGYVDEGTLRQCLINLGQG